MASHRRGTERGEKWGCKSCLRAAAWSLTSDIHPLLKVWESSCFQLPGGMEVQGTELSIGLRSAWGVCDGAQGHGCCRTAGRSRSEWTGGPPIPRRQCADTPTMSRWGPNSRKCKTPGTTQCLLQKDSLTKDFKRKITKTFNNFVFIFPMKVGTTREKWGQLEKIKKSPFPLMSLWHNFWQQYRRLIGAQMSEVALNGSHFAHEVWSVSASREGGWERGVGVLRKKDKV